MDEQTTNTQDPGTTGTGGTGEPLVNSPQMTPEQIANALDPEGIKDNAASIIDKTIEQIKDEADKLGGDVKAAGAKVRHAAHDVLDEMEQHLSQYAFETHAAFHGFLSRLRSMF